MEWWISSYKNPFDKKCIPLFTGIILINKKETQKKKTFQKDLKKMLPKLARDCASKYHFDENFCCVLKYALKFVHIKYEYLKIL